jgi:hypothetical protein
VAFVDPNQVVPNARRDNFEEDERWLKIREELTPICDGLVKQARSVSKEHQRSRDVQADPQSKMGVWYPLPILSFRH